MKGTGYGIAADNNCLILWLILKVKSLMIGNGLMVAP